MRNRIVLSVMVAGLLIGCSGTAEDGPGPPLAASGTPAHQPTEASEVASQDDQDGQCGAAKADEPRVRKRFERRLSRRLIRVIEGAGWQYLGGDHAYQDASAAIEVKPDIFASAVVYPKARVCTRAGTFKERHRASESEVEVVYGRLHGEPAARFDCRHLRYDISAEDRGVMRVVTSAFIEQLRATCT